MATGGFKSNATTDFLEEWKAKREKMRAKMLGDIAAATGAPLAASSSANGSRGETRHAAGTELTNNGNPERGAPAGNCLPSCPVARSSSGSSLKKPEEETQQPAAAAPTASPVSLKKPEEETQQPAAAAPTASPVCALKKAPPQPEKPQCASQDSSPLACHDSDKESPSPSKSKEKKSAGPSARKGKGQIEKRKLREKRRSTGVVSIPSNE
ncbi:hypothetical protein LDENG_00150850, partial [Lucifuga dentata]